MKLTALLLPSSHPWIQNQLKRLWLSVWRQKSVLLAFSPRPARSVLVKGVVKHLSLLGLITSLGGCAAIQKGGDLTLMLNNLMIQSIAIFDLLIAFCYLAGACFLVKGMYEFKTYGEQRTSMSQQTTIRVPITHVLVGLSLLYAPSMISIMSNSIMGQPTVILAYFDPAYAGADGTWAEVETAVVTLLQICGLVAFIRGFFMLSQTQTGPNGGVGKGLTHIFAGLLLLNLPTFMQILYNSA